MDPVDLLLTRLVEGGKWPPNAEARTWSEVKAWRAFREADRDALAKVADWQDKDRLYKVDPLPERIADAWGDHLFGEELETTPGNEGDIDILLSLLEPNDITEEARAAEADLVVPEGEGWWRIYKDEELEDVPLLEWHSRATVAPLFIGKKLLAVALITVLEGKPNQRAGKNAIYRHLEIHVDGAVEHVLFRGTKDKIGGTVPLDAHPETEGLPRTLQASAGERVIWRHELPMLMGRIVNKRGRNPRLGRSEYAPIKDYLLDLNEAFTIQGENRLLTAKKRVVVPPTSSMLRRRPSTEHLVDNGEGQLVPGRFGAPRFAAGEDVIVADPVDSELGRDSTPYKVLEYSYDAAALILDKRDLVESAVTRVGLTPQWIGVRVDGPEGFAATGTALRLRLIPTDKAGRGKARPWDRELPRILGLMQRLHALDLAKGGFGAAGDWTDPEANPSVKRANALPSDPVEEATTEATLLAAGARSIETAVRKLNPDKAGDEDWIKAEVDRIRKDRAATGVMGGLA